MPTTTPPNRRSSVSSSESKFNHLAPPIGSMPPMPRAQTAKSPWKLTRSRIGCTNGTGLHIQKARATSRSESDPTTGWITHRLKSASTNSISLHQRSWWTCRRKAAFTTTVRFSSKAPLLTRIRAPTEAMSSRFGSTLLVRAPRNRSSSRVQPVGPTSGTSSIFQPVNTPCRFGLRTAISASEKLRWRMGAWLKLAPSPSTTTTFHPISNSRGSALKTSRAAASTAAPCVLRTTPRSWALLETSEGLLPVWRLKSPI